MVERGIRRVLCTFRNALDSGVKDAAPRPAAVKGGATVMR